MDKVVSTAAEAVRDIPDGANIFVGGFGVMQGNPISLLDALRRQGTRELTAIANTPGIGPTSLQALVENRQLRKLIASFAAYPTRPTPSEEAIRAGTLEVELVPQGTLAERVRAGAAGVAAFYTPTSVGTPVAAGKEERIFDGHRYVLETALRADFALIRAHTADRYGNLTYRGGSRNLNPLFAAAARVTIAEVDEIVESGAIDPEKVVTPGIYVDRVVRTENPLNVEQLLAISRAWGRQQRLEARSAPGVPSGLTPELMAYKAASLLRPGEYVNLGIGMPTLVSNFITPEQRITLHAENGILGYGPLASEGNEDLDMYNAGGQLVTLHPGASFFHTCDAFAMARSGRVGTVVLGAFQVDERGNLANWNVPATGIGGIGGAMDLASGNARVLVIMFHTERNGALKLLRECTYPLTAIGCVHTVITDLALIDVDGKGFLVREIAPGVSTEDVARFTGAPVRFAAGLKEMV